MPLSLSISQVQAPGSPSHLTSSVWIPRPANGLRAPLVHARFTSNSTQLASCCLDGERLSILFCLSRKLAWPTLAAGALFKLWPFRHSPVSPVDINRVLSVLSRLHRGS